MHVLKEDGTKELNIAALFAAHPHRVLLLVREDGEGGLFLAGDQEKAAAGIIKLLQQKPELKNWLAGILEKSSKK